MTVLSLIVGSHLAIARVTLPSQKGHQQNCQVLLIFCVFFEGYYTCVDVTTKEWQGGMWEGPQTACAEWQCHFGSRLILVHPEEFHPALGSALARRRRTCHLRGRRRLSNPTFISHQPSGRAGAGRLQAKKLCAESQNSKRQDGVFGRKTEWYHCQRQSPRMTEPLRITTSRRAPCFCRRENLLAGVSSS